MYTQVQTRCNVCGGDGHIIPDHCKCKACHGQKKTNQRKTLEISIKPGALDGTTFIFPEASNEEPGAQTGDVIVELLMVPTPTKRRGPDLYVTQHISLVESLSGFKFIHETPDARSILVESDPQGTVILTGDVKVVPGEGMPLLDNPTERGNLYIQFIVDHPKIPFVTVDQLGTLAERIPCPKVGTDSFPFRAAAVDIEGTQPNFKFTQEEARDEAQGESQEGGERVQCAQQ